MEGTLHPMGPFLLLFTPSGTKLHHGQRAGLLLGFHVENTSGGECLQTLRTPQAEGKRLAVPLGAAAHLERGPRPSSSINFVLHVPFVNVQKYMGGLDCMQQS